MPRANPIRAVCGKSLLVGLVVATGCVNSRTDLQDRLAQRVAPADADVARPTSQPQVKGSDRATTDAKVLPAIATQPGQRTEARTENGRSTPLPAALEGPPRGVEPDRSPRPAMPLPSDSDEAALDAIAASGKTITLADAVKLAFRYQPRLHAQLESIAQARGLQQIVFSTFLPIVAANYDVGEFSLGVGGKPIPLGNGLPGFNFLPGLGALPIGLNIGTNFELAELKIQWLLLDFGRRLGRYEQARLANDVAQLQTERAYQTVANDVAIAFYNVLRSQALRHTAQDALRRADEELADARKREREGVVEREVVLRTAVQRAENVQQLHAATGAEFVALAGLNLAIGLKSNQPVRVAESPEIPPLAISLADCLQTAIRERREFAVVQRTVEIAVQGGRVARADFAPKVIADGTLFNFQQQHQDGHADLRMGFIRLDWTLFEGGRRIAATRVADSQVRQAMAQAESITDNIAFQVNEAYRSAVTAWVGIDDARPAVDQASENFRLVHLRLREGAATPTEIADAQASLTRAQQNYLNARYNYLIALDRLEYAMGVGQTPMSQAPKHH
jgi:outer membrane protein TolC